MKEFYQKSFWDKLLTCIGVVTTVLMSIIAIFWLYDKFLTVYSQCNSPKIWAGGTTLIILVLLVIIVWFLCSRFVTIRIKIGKRGVDCKDNEIVTKQENGLREIKNYWGVRTDAAEDIKTYLKTIKGSDDSLIISAIGFRTLESVLTDPKIVEHVVGLMKGNHNRFKIVIIFPKDATEWKRYRPDLKNKADGEVEENIKNGHKLIGEFIEDVKKEMSKQMTAEQVKNTPLDKKIELRHYKEDAFPRHFILKGNDAIFVGSYLSHSKGSSTYLLQLLQLQQCEEGLFNMFKTEADHIYKEHSTLISCEDFLGDNTTNT